MSWNINLHNDMKCHMVTFVDYSKISTGRKCQTAELEFSGIILHVGSQFYSDCVDNLYHLQTGLNMFLTDSFRVCVTSVS